MINAWSLLYDELYGDDEMTDKTYPVENTELNDDKIEINIGTGNTIFNVPEDLETEEIDDVLTIDGGDTCLLYTSPSPRDLSTSRMPSSA